MNGIKHFIIIFAIIGLMVVFVPNLSHAVTPLTCWMGEPIELEYTIDNGFVGIICDNDGPVVEIITQINNDGGQLIIEIPRTLVYFVNQDCESQDIIILVNDEEVEHNIENTPLSRIITLDLPPEQVKIEFIGSYTLGDDVHQYCGVIYGYESQYLSPKKQVENGRSVESVRCNDELELILKNIWSPACVKPETAIKLNERGWTR